MTKLEELKAASDAASRANSNDSWYSDDGYVYTMDEGYLVCCATDDSSMAVNEQDEHNLKFIALAHNNMPLLLEAVELLEQVFKNPDNIIQEIGDVLSILEKLK